jgi:hypothetical protein
MGAVNLLRTETMPSAEIARESVRLFCVSAGAAISQLRRSTAFCAMQREGMPRVAGPRNPNDAKPFAALQSLGCGGQCNNSGAAHSFTRDCYGKTHRTVFAQESSRRPSPNGGIVAHTAETHPSARRIAVVAPRFVRRRNAFHGLVLGRC